MGTTSGVDPQRVRQLLGEEDARFVAARPETMRLLEQARGVMPNGVPMSWHATDNDPPIYVAEGRGSRFRDVDGHEYVDFNIADITELWRRGSVIASWLLDLTAIAFAEHPQLEGFSGRVSDSGEGRWTINAAVEEGVPVPVLSAALFQRFSSRGEADFANKILSAMRFQFGGHVERK